MKYIHVSKFNKKLIKNPIFNLLVTKNQISCSLFDGKGPHWHCDEIKKQNKNKKHLITSKEFEECIRNVTTVNKTRILRIYNYNIFSHSVFCPVLSLGSRDEKKTSQIHHSFFSTILVLLLWFLNLKVLNINS